MLTKYSLFLGCIVPNRYPGIEAATKKVFNKLGVTLLDLPGASCCPAPGVVGSFSEETWIMTAARNLVLAEKNGADIVNVCNGCFGTLYEVNSLLKTDINAKERANKVLADIGLTFTGSIEVHHFSKLLFDKYLEQISTLGKKRLHGLKLAIHYGCHLLRPKELKNVDNPEKPDFIDEIVRQLDGISIAYKDKNMCCGAGGGVRTADIDVALDMTQEKLENIKDSNADCILNVCSFCHLQFDRGQKELSEATGVDYQIPVIHLSQLLGLAFGFSPVELGLRAHAVPTTSLLQKIGAEVV